MQTSLVLYGLSRSVYTRIVRLVLEEKGLSYVLEEVEIFDAFGAPPEHVARHPFGRIPVLRHGDFQLYETAAICRYLDEVFLEPSLQPHTPIDRARMAQIIGMLDSYAYRPMVWGVFVQRVSVPMDGEVTDETEVAKALQQVETALDALERLQGPSEFLVGSSLTLADLHAFPMLKYLSLTRDGEAAVAARPRLKEWLAWIDRRPSVLRTRSRYERASAR